MIDTTRPPIETLIKKALVKCEELLSPFEESGFLGSEALIDVRAAIAAIGGAIDRNALGNGTGTSATPPQANHIGDANNMVAPCEISVVDTEIGAEAIERFALEHDWNWNFSWASSKLLATACAKVWGLKWK